MLVMNVKVAKRSFNEEPEMIDIFGIEFKIYADFLVM